jgi:putative ABC transport system permease protein
LSHKLEGEIPIRLIHAGDANAYLGPQGRPLLDPGRVLVSHTLAERFDLAPGDRVLIDTDGERFRFVVSEVSDDPGFFADEGQYVDLKSWFLFDAAAPLFADNLALTLGERLAVRGPDGGPPDDLALAPLETDYRVAGWGHERSGWQTSEIDRDFSIFDFILGLTLVLAGVGVANSLLIQVLARRRELALLRTLGVSRAQTLRLLLLEGVLIGAVGGLFALALGHLLAAVGVAFLDRFTLFDYRLWPSWSASLQVLGLAVLTCAAAALYPALAANRISSAESLHYE